MEGKGRKRRACRPRSRAASPISHQKRGGKREGGGDRGRGGRVRPKKLFSLSPATNNRSNRCWRRASVPYRVSPEYRKGEEERGRGGNREGVHHPAEFSKRVGFAPDFSDLTPPSSFFKRRGGGEKKKKRAEGGREAKRSLTASCCGLK